MAEFNVSSVEQVAFKREANWAAAVQHAPRLGTVNNLRQHFSLESDIDPEAEWIQSEANPAVNTASIGIELELWWSHILPSELAGILTSGAWNELTEQEKQKFNEQAEPIGFPHMESCRETIGLGIPSRGQDGLWEFSHRPAWHNKTLLEEVSQLVGAGLVPEERSVPIHITLGGVEADSRLQLVLRILELSGNSSIERLSNTDPASGWARRGRAGVSPRSKWKLELGQTKGAELRTLVFQNLQQFERLLECAQNAANLIRSADEGDARAETSWRLFAKAVEETAGMTTDAVGWIDPAIDNRQWNTHLKLLADSALTNSMRQILNDFVL